MPWNDNIIWPIYLALAIREAKMSSTQLTRNYGSSEYETIEVTAPAQYVIRVQLNRPEKSNAMNRVFWR